LLGFYTIIVITERTLVYRSTKNGSKAFSQRVALALSANETQTAIDLSKNSDSGPLPKILTEVLQIKQAASENDFDAQAFQAAAINYASAECEREMKKNLFGLGKAGKIALILGCLGTCIGILDAVGRLGFLGATEYYDDLFSIFTWQLTRSFNIFFFSLVITVPCLWFTGSLLKRPSTCSPSLKPIHGN
jgi:biopolymer transport protein ExbB/TolQ